MDVILQNSNRRTTENRKPHYYILKNTLTQAQNTRGDKKKNIPTLGLLRLERFIRYTQYMQL